MSEQPALQGRSLRRSLAADVQGRKIPRPMRGVPDTPLPLARKSVPSGQTPATVQAQADAGAGQPQGTEVGNTTTEPAEANQRAAVQPSLEQVAERVYELLRRDLHLERERSGW